MKENEMMNTQSTSENNNTTIIKVGKINCVVREIFSDNGKEIDELLEKLIVQKYQNIA